jgi:hypothetical protein
VYLEYPLYCLIYIAISKYELNSIMSLSICIHNPNVYATHNPVTQICKQPSRLRTSAALTGICSPHDILSHRYIPSKRKMSQHLEHFGKQRLTTEFLDGSTFIYRHTYSNPGTLLRVETWARVETLGSGTFGTVYKEVCAETKTVRAVKRIHIRLAKSNELDILTQLRAVIIHTDSMHILLGAIS